MLDPARLDGVALFDGLKPAALRELSARGRIVSFEAGETLWREGTEARGLYVILSGRVRVASHGAGRPLRIHLEGPGGTLGEIPLFDGARYPATAVADTAAKCAAFADGALRAAIAADPELAFRLLANLGSRVRGLVERLDALTGMDVRQRLAAHLLGRLEERSDMVVSLRGSQSDLAEELGTVREVVVRALRQLEEAGAIRRDARRIRVCDAELLRRLAD